MFEAQDIMKGISYWTDKLSHEKNHCMRLFYKDMIRLYTDMNSKPIVFKKGIRQCSVATETQQLLLL